MTRDEFASLPPMIALGLIWDVASAKLRELPRPEVPRAPLYDGRLSRGNQGFVWMSEMLLRDLEWWEKKKSESASSDSKYAEKDAKTAANLRNWIAWRRLFPSDVWSGKRGDDRASAAPPNGKPALNEWGPRAGGQAKPKTGGRPEPEPRHEEEPEEGYGF